MGELFQQLLEEIVQNAQKNGALLVGTTKIRRIEPVLIFAFPFTDKWFLSHPFNVTRFLGIDYQVSRNVQLQTVKLLQGAGYRAESKTVLSVFGDFRPLAVAAGLGQWGRNGLIVNERYGANLLFAAIFTDMPVETSTPLTSEVEHCNSCSHCIDACPAKVFAEGRFNYVKCLPYALRGCSECVKACHH